MPPFRLEWIAGAAVLAISLGLKASGDYTIGEDALAKPLAQVSQSLQERGFTTNVIPSRRAIEARAPEGCMLDLRIVDAHATLRENLHLRLSRYYSVRYIWRGTFVAQPPKIMPLVEFYLKREAARRGLAMQRNAVWVMGASDKCEIGDVRFADIPVPFARAAD